MNTVDWHYVVLYGAYLYNVALTAVGTLGYFSNLYLPPAALFNYYPVGVQAGLMLAGYEQKDGALLLLGVFFALLGIILNGCYLNTVIQTTDYQANSFKGSYTYTPGGVLQLDTTNLYNETAKNVGYQVANWTFTGINIGLEIVWSIWSIWWVYQWRKPDSETNQPFMEQSLVCDIKALKFRVAISYICIICSIVIGGIHTILGLIAYNDSILTFSPFQNQYAWMYTVLAWGIYPPIGYLVEQTHSHHEGVYWPLMEPGALQVTWLMGLLFTGVYGGITLGYTGYWRSQNHMNMFCPNSTTFPQELVYFPHQVQTDELTLQIVTLNGPPTLRQQLVDFSCIDDVLGFLLVMCTLLVFIMGSVLFGYPGLDEKGQQRFEEHQRRVAETQQEEIEEDDLPEYRGLIGRMMRRRGRQNLDLYKVPKRPSFFRN